MSPRATRGPAHTRGPSAAGEREVNVALKGSPNKGKSGFGSDVLAVQKKLESAKTFDGDAPSAHHCRAFCAGWRDICSNMTDEPGLFTSRVSVNGPSVDRVAAVRFGPVRGQNLNPT